LVIFHNGKSEKKDIDLLNSLIKEKVYFVPGRSFCFVQNSSLYTLFTSNPELEGVLEFQERILFAFLIEFISFENLF